MILHAHDLYERVLNEQPVIHHGKELAALHGMPTGSFISRFVRAGAPTPKVIVREALLVRVAEMHDDGRSLYAVANRLQFSSAQHLSRFLRQTCGVTSPAALTGGRRSYRRTVFRQWLLEEHAAAIDAALGASVRTADILASMQSAA